MGHSAMKHILFFLTILLATNVAFAQNVAFTKSNFKKDKEGLRDALQSIEKGDELLKSGLDNNQEALESYHKAYDLNPKNAILNYKIGKCYLNSNYRIKSLSYFEEAYRLDSIVTVDIHLMLGTVYQLNGQWDKAIEQYNKHLSLLHITVNAAEIKRVKKYIRECNVGTLLVTTPAKLVKKNVGMNINSAFPDYLPVISADESMMIFTSRRPTGKSGYAIDENTGEYLEDVYQSLKVDGEWGTATVLKGKINTRDHDANCGISPDGQKLIVYKSENDGDLYESNLEGTDWTDPVSFGENINSKYHESSAWYSPDLNKLYFVSDRPGGFGGRDIYMSRKSDDGKWLTAHNLGNTVNTPYNEEGVFMHPDGKTLYFSSRGHNTMGGYDIFRTQFDDKTNTWSAPVNLGIPLNTPDDDVFFVLSANGKHGYYSTFSKTGYGEKDIVMVDFSELEDSVEIAKMGGNITVIKGVVVDEETKKPMQAKVELVDNESSEVLGVYKSNSATGKYLIVVPTGKNYGVVISEGEHLFQSINVNLPKNSSYKEVLRDVKMDSISVGNRIILRNVFFDFNKSTLRPASVSELNRVVALLNERPSLRVELSGHTDSRGALVYNQELSYRRAHAVIQYLIEKGGIAPTRLAAKGYGETMPLVPNTSEENMQLNRRTEVKILSKEYGIE